MLATDRPTSIYVMDSAAALPFSTITLRPTSTAQIQWKELTSTSKEGTWFARVSGYENIPERHRVIGKACLKFMSQPHGGGDWYFIYSRKEETSPPWFHESYLAQCPTRSHMGP